ncbi:hypothetical protein [Novosphingobium humi]|uniref:hypothetical protein n=1 Tax=Novosphingobium humi TaxID=2282397 RepID=UPI0025B07868|nr:hypothetical protein [Novosphingobium humi]WJS99858.1 hypothetical protein NYQ05_06895 [Novosphingobium humi]
MRIDEITAPKPPKKPKSLKPRKPLPKSKTIKPSAKALPNIKPQTASQAMIAAKKRDVQVAKDALKAQQAYQKRHKELEAQRKKLAKR